jgi:hypothetical protein
MHSKCLHIAVLVLFCLACDNVPEMQIGTDKEVRYVIFSSFDPSCIEPDCAATFKIDNLKFFKDTENTITRQEFPYNGRYEFFSASEPLVKSFLDGIPHKLLQEEENNIGECNNCNRIYLEIGFEDKTRYWIIANEEDKQPVYIQNLVNQVQSTIAQLQNL